MTVKFCKVRTIKFYMNKVHRIDYFSVGHHKIQRASKPCPCVTHLTPSHNHRPSWNIPCSLFSNGPWLRVQRVKQGVCALHAGHLRPQTHTHNMQYFLTFHDNKSYPNAAQCHVIRTVCVCVLYWYLLCAITQLHGRNHKINSLMKNK